MVNLRSAAYNSLFLLAALVGVSGCGGKDTPPPPGAPTKEPSSIDVEIGADSSPTDTTGTSTTSSPDATAPEGEQGDKK